MRKENRFMKEKNRLLCFRTRRSFEQSNNFACYRKDLNQFQSIGKKFYRCS